MKKERKIAIRPIIVFVILLTYIRFGFEACIATWQGEYIFSLHFWRNIDSPVFLGVIGFLIVLGIFYSYHRQHVRLLETGEINEEEYRELSKFHKKFSCGIAGVFLLFFLVSLVGQIVHMPQNGKFFGEYYLAYEVNEDGETCTITSAEMLPHVQNFSVPEEINGYRVTKIAGFSFASCKNLKNVTISSSVSTIGGYAFRECRGLASVTIPDSVTLIGDDAFIYCSNLKEFIVDENNAVYQSVDGNVYSKDGTVFVLYAAGKKEKEFIIPDSVTTIGDWAFSNCKSLTSVTIPDSVTTIGRHAFFRCSRLKSVTIPDSVTTIDDSAFSNCKSLTSVTIPDSVTTIGDWAFSNCKSLTSVTIPNSVTTIGRHAFSRCSRLKSVTIPDSVTTIGDSAFSNCKSLTSVTIPDSVIDIRDSAFESCNSKLYTKYEKGKYIGDSENPYAVLIGITSKLKNTYTIHPQTKIIAANVFENCKSIKSIEIPNSVTTISGDAFKSCSNLTSVTIFDSVEIIGGAFDYCSNITDVYYICSEDGREPIVDSNNSDSTNGIIHYTSKETISSILNSYVAGSEKKGSATGGGILEIPTIEFPTMEFPTIEFPTMEPTTITPSTPWEPTTLSFSYQVNDDGETCTITDINGLNWKNISIEAYIDGYKVTHIGSRAFAYCFYLESITIPDSVTSIDSYAFCLCYSLSSVTFEGTIEQWNNIQKDSLWDDMTIDYTIYCTDGEIKNDGTVTYY